MLVNFGTDLAQMTNGSQALTNGIVQTMMIGLAQATMNR